MALAPQDEPLDDSLSLLGSEPLVPILRLDEGQADPVALATWHQALSNTASIEVPHDLMGLWLYPAQGGVVLLGPSELAADDLAIPIPTPHLRPEQLAAVEDRVLKAGYGSATCLPIRFGKRDVALLLVAGPLLLLPALMLELLAAALRRGGTVVVVGRLQAAA